MNNTDRADVSPAYLNKGDQAWQLTAATLVGLQTVPGLICLYAGLVRRKWAVNSMFMVLCALARRKTELIRADGFAMTLVCWMIWVYNVR